MSNAGNVITNGTSHQLPENPTYFSQFSISEILTLPDQKPDMEQLVSVTVKPEIIAFHLIDTPCMKSYEGQLLSGKKLIVELNLKEIITYVADKPSQSTHAAHFDKTLKSVFVVVPKEVSGTPIETLLKQKKLVVTPYIEDIFAMQRDERTVFKNITVLVDVTFC